MYQVFVYSITPNLWRLGNPVRRCAAPLRHRPDQDRRRNGSEPCCQHLRPGRCAERSKLPVQLRLCTRPQPWTCFRWW